MAAATENLPLAFASLLAGGLLIEHGVATAKPAFAGGGTVAGATGPIGPGGAIQSPAGLTVQGSPATAAQVTAANVLLGVAHQLNAPKAAAVAMIYSAIYESNLTQGDPRNSAGYGGVLAAGSHYDVNDSAGQAKGFLLGDPSTFQAGGAIHLAQTGAGIPEIAIRVQVPSIWPSNAYASESGYGSDSRAIAEATKWVDAFGGFQ